jgi:hypothetical protein
MWSSLLARWTRPSRYGSAPLYFSSLHNRSSSAHITHAHLFPVVVPRTQAQSDNTLRTLPPRVSDVLVTFLPLSCRVSSPAWVMLVTGCSVPSRPRLTTSPPPVALVPRLLPPLRRRVRWAVAAAQQLPPPRADRPGAPSGQSPSRLVRMLSEKQEF